MTTARWGLLCFFLFSRIMPDLSFACPLCLFSGLCFASCVSRLSFVFVLDLYVAMALGIISIWKNQKVRRVAEGVPVHLCISALSRSHVGARCIERGHDLAMVKPRFVSFFASGHVWWWLSDSSSFQSYFKASLCIMKVL
jgi:hypothetical protein